MNAVLCLLVLAAGPTYELRSPDGKTSVVVTTDGGLRIAAARGGTSLLEPSPVGLSVGGRALGFARVTSVKREEADRTVPTVFWARRATVRDRFRQLTLALEDGMGLVVRAYDDAVAYRLTTDLPGTIKIDGETVRLAFAGAPTLWAPVVDCAKPAKKGLDCFHSSFEELYTVAPLGRLRPDQQAFLPVLVDGGARRPKVLVTESDLDDYPGLWLRGTGGAALEGTFARVPIEEIVVGTKYPQAAVKTRAPFIAETEGRRAYPWRVLGIAARDVDLPAHDIVYRLGGETPSTDWSWLRPGKSRSEWLWENLLYDVDFESGLNTKTYRFYADFAARFGLGYLFFDAGWSSITDPMALTPGLDVPGLIAYARDKGLGTVLWTSALAMSRGLEPVLDRFAAWGVRGVMVDFMDRDDQATVRFYRRVVEGAAKRRMFVNFHGAFKPTGLERRFPNAATREGLMAFEYNKWSDTLTPEYEVTLPFIRGVAGPMDYEPGQMRNAQPAAFRIVDGQPMSQGTRMHQAAMFLVYESPYAKMGGNVSDYLREPAFTSFLASIPTLWEETRVLAGVVGDYIVVMRRARDGAFWIGAMTDGSPRTVQVPLGFLPKGAFSVAAYNDGPNAPRFGADWVRTERSVKASDALSIVMAPGGGFVARITPAQ